MRVNADSAPHSSLEMSLSTPSNQYLPAGLINQFISVAFVYMLSSKAALKSPHV